jgi:glucose/galactose transporter
MNEHKRKSYIFPLITIGGLFFILGFITWLNSILIPYLRTACELTDFQALFVTSAFYISYTIMALPSSFILNKIGFKNGISLSLIVMALGAFVFIPAAETRIYIYFLTGLFILGSGMALLQTAVNPYVTILGSPESAASRISFMGIANKIAGALAPLVLAVYIVQDGDSELINNLQTLSFDEKNEFLNQLALRVQTPYYFIAFILLALGLFVRFIKLPTVESEISPDDMSQSKKTVFSYPHIWLGALTLFFYVGVEVIAGDTIIRYSQSIGMPMEYAKNMATYTMLAMLFGYVLGILFIPKLISQQNALKFSAILGIVMSFGVVFFPAEISIYLVALLGLANALVWPAVWPLALKGVGSLINTASALLIMAISGGAIIPLIWGYMSDIVGSQWAYFVLIPAYFFILFYSIKGHKIKTENFEN